MVSAIFARPEFRPRSAIPAAPDGLAGILTAMGAVAPGDLLRARAVGARDDAGLAAALLAHGWIEPRDHLAALCRLWVAEAADLRKDPPDSRLVDAPGVAFWLRHGAIPWRRIGGATVIATAHPAEFRALVAQLPAERGPWIMAIAPEDDIRAAAADLRRTALIREAETRVPEALSCRSRKAGRAAWAGLAALALAAAGVWVAPRLAFALVFGWAVVTLVATTLLKALAGLAVLRAPAPGIAPAPDPVPVTALPMVSMMVPLFDESDIAGRLVARLGRLAYPRHRLEVLLVVEEEDARTRAALARARLPAWMRVVIVPDGPLRTKPRALNYALNFCRGGIVGVWDAEDAPEPGQIHKVVRHFAAAAPDVACLQGILDFYNPGHNWLTRCFTVEYAAWFRAMLPGLARLGLVVPLGGTTLFFRREILERLGGWDAHNVTEDADLGLRLARAGYRTELIDTVTAEEPNARVWPWIRQRSRWIKGYAMTWGVHMRDPAALWRDLGPRRFLAVQVLFLGSLSQALLAPVLWSFWLIALGLPHPLSPWVGGWPGAVLSALFLTSEALAIAVGLWAVRGPDHRHLRPWVPTLHVYFPLAALAAWKALHEVVTRPFYWDKTSHGAVDALPAAAPAAVTGPFTGPAAPPRPA